MTAKQFSAALDSLGFSIAGFARTVGIHERTVHRYAAGQWPVPIAIGMLLNLMLKTNSTVKDLQI